MMVKRIIPVSFECMQIVADNCTINFRSKNFSATCRDNGIQNF